MCVRPGLACNHSQFQQFIADKQSSIAALEALRHPKSLTREYRMGRVIFSGTVLVLCLGSGWSVGQDLKPRPAAENQDKSLSRSSPRIAAENAGGLPVMVPMSAAAGNPIQGAL